MASEFEDLQPIAALMEERALARHRDMLVQEDALRRELDEIENLRHRSLRQDDQAHARRMLGADGVWQNWLAQRRLRLTQELAVLQVRKAETLAAAQTAFARHQVTADLAADDREVQRRRNFTLAERRLEEDWQTSVSASKGY
ncbi:hypothetical protein [Puniceibacterium confluentis]|uniref:hypothetical protein n=1 Tax=Puniceibacterium confluentis TaxID=1958944 RepID=UPI0011B7FC99|nr:hypothetical protein [Puniceibacterium confluentis]